MSAILATFKSLFATLIPHLTAFDIGPNPATVRTIFKTPVEVSTANLISFIFLFFSSILSRLSFTTFVV